MKMTLGDIVPAELQNAPDYSASAPLFLYTLNEALAGSSSYYNPTQASQSTPGGAVPNTAASPASYYDSDDSTAPILLSNGGNGMTADQATCTQIQCGAISPSQAGQALIEQCSLAGYVGVRSCNDPVCTPYLPQMQANGICGATPGPTPSPVPMPSATTATMPSITATAQVVAPMQVITPRGMQQRMPQIVNPTPAVITQPCDDSFASWVNANPLLAVGALAVLAYFALGKGK